MKTKRLLLIELLLSFLCPTETTAGPADPSVRRIVTLPNGSKAEAVLSGDEYLSYWRLDDGSGMCFYEIDLKGQPVLVPLDSMKSRRKSMRKDEAQMIIPQHRFLPPSILQGERRVPVILIQYSDLKFQSNNTPEYLYRFFNESGFSDDLFKGSVRDYFLAQSNGKLRLQFDIYGPVTLSNTQAYYGEDEGLNKQKNMPELLKETVALADKDLDFSLYDWDGDGQVEQFVIIYAGMGQAGGAGSEAIWGHKSRMIPEVHDGVVVADYCCAQELIVIDNKPHISGIGTICHEFSHCLGLPDMYDSDDLNYGTKFWDPMCNGLYQDNGFTPAGYTGYEKMVLGWQQPIILEKSCHIEGMKAMSEGGDFYMIVNDNHTNEYYLLENRQKTGWDSAIPGNGLLITHIDYDSSFFNIPNKTKDTENTHPRCEIINADNNKEIDYYSDKIIEDLRGDLYGYKNHEFTDSTNPASTLYNYNIDGSKFMGKPVTKIYESSDGTISFDFENKVANKPDFMLGTDDMRLKYNSNNAINVCATITNYSHNTYNRFIGAFVYGNGEWRSQAFKMMNLAPKSSEEISLTLGDLQENIDYYVALYYYENDTTEYWRGMTDFKKFDMNSQNKFNISVIGIPKQKNISESEATIDVVIHNESMSTFNKPIRAFLWVGDILQEGGEDYVQEIQPYANKNYKFTFTKLNPQTSYDFNLYYYDETDSTSNPWKHFYGPKILFTGIKASIYYSGDVNGDGAVDVADIASVIDCMAGNEAVSKTKADVNGDGTVDVADIAAIIDEMAARARRL